MPLKSGEIRSAYMRGYRRRRHLEQEKLEAPEGGVFISNLPSIPESVGEQVQLVADWIRTLTIPPGHFRSGKKMEPVPFFLEFLRGSLAPGIAEALMCIARKNGKTANIALLALTYLCGPLRAENWYGCVVSLNKAKARGLLLLAHRFIETNDLPVKIIASPYLGELRIVWFCSGESRWNDIVVSWRGRGVCRVLGLQIQS